MSILKFITPTNLQTERDKYFGSPSYHPQFTYDWNEVTNKDSLIEAVINQEIKQITIQAEARFAVDWSDDILKQAQTIISSPPEKLPPPPTLQQLVEAQKTALKQLNIDYEIVVSDQTGFVARPEHKSRRLVISSDVNYHYFSLESSIRHDAVHIVRALNGAHNHIKRSSDYLPTEEGLASFMQDYGGNETNASLFQHAAEYAVTDICRTGSLRDAIDYLISIGFPPNLAWQRAARHKFGFIDTSKPGDIMKPAMYFCHEQKIKQIPQDDIIKLFIGKIALEELPNYSKYSGKWSPDQLKDFFFS
jgi:hypothetical protein